MIDYFIGYDLFVEGNIFLVFLPENRRMRNVLLETGRLVLRKLEQGDFDEVCKLLQDPVVMYAYEGAFSDQEVQAWLAEWNGGGRYSCQTLPGCRDATYRF